MNAITDSDFKPAPRRSDYFNNWASCMFDWTDWGGFRPPASDVYNASRERNEELLRRWDGEAWSMPWHESDCGNEEREMPDPRGAARMEWRDLTLETKLWLIAESVPLPGA